MWWTTACAKCGLGLSPLQWQSGSVSPEFVSIFLPCVLHLSWEFDILYVARLHLAKFNQACWATMGPWAVKMIQNERGCTVSETVIRQHHNGMVLWIFQTSSLVQTCANQKNMRDCERNSESSSSTFFDGGALYMTKESLQHSSMADILWSAHEGEVP